MQQLGKIEPSQIITRKTPRWRLKKNEVFQNIEGTSHFSILVKGIFMLLVIDIGNSHTVTGLYKKDRLIGQWRMKSDIAKTDDEIAAHYHALFSMVGISVQDISGVILASVVPALETVWKSCCKKYLLKDNGKKIISVSAKTLAGLINIALPNPKEIGTDRLVNGISAYEQLKRPLVVVDFGTAITFDCVAADCTYVGGAILPGVAISLEALATRTAPLPHIDIHKLPEKVIGTNTVEAMTSGIIYGYGAMIDGMIDRIEQEMLGDSNEELGVIATGGMAPIITPASRRITQVDQLITLKGLVHIYEQTVLA